MLNAYETGKNIKRLCIDKGITPNTIRDKLGFTTTTPIYKWFRGQNMPSLDNIVELANLLNVSIDDLLIIDSELI